MILPFVLKATGMAVTIATIITVVKYAYDDMALNNLIMRAMGQREIILYSKQKDDADDDIDFYDECCLDECCRVKERQAEENFAKILN